MKTSATIFQKPSATQKQQYFYPTLLDYRRVFMKNQLSICILIYKSIEYIDRCIESLLCQTDLNFEIVLVDNASPDNSVNRAIDMLESNGFNNWKVVKIANNTGCGQGRTKGYLGASGAYIKHLDSDDTLPPYFVEQINNIIMHRSPDIITYGHNIVDVNDKLIRSIAPYKSTIFAKYSLNMFWRYTFKRELAVKAQIDTSGMHYAEDRVFSIRLIPYINNVEIVHMQMYNYCKNPSSATSCKDQQVYEESTCQVFNEYKLLYDQVNNNYEKQCLLYSITYFYLQMLSRNCRGDSQQQDRYFKLYKDKYLQSLGLNKYKAFRIIPKGCLSFESLVIQILYH